MTRQAVDFSTPVETAWAAIQCLWNAPDLGVSADIGWR